ncbi:hypothetical protein SLA2020_086470 [Shorea laevis]
MTILKLKGNILIKIYEGQSPAKGKSKKNGFRDKINRGLDRWPLKFHSWEVGGLKQPNYNSFPFPRAEARRLLMAKAKPLGATEEFFRRKHPMLSNQLRHTTPGLGIALVAFVIYLVGELVYNRVYAPSPSSHSH